MNFELAVKRSKLNGELSDSDAVSQVWCTFADYKDSKGRRNVGMRVNFDAEHISDRIDMVRSKLENSYRFYWSETIQTSASDASVQARRAAELATKKSGFGINFVIGNTKYDGCSGRTETLSKIIGEFYAQLGAPNRSWRMSLGNIKIGAEGIKNGMKAAALCVEYGTTLYVLQNDNALQLLDNTRGLAWHMKKSLHELDTAMYTIVRFNDGLIKCRERALKELVHKVGESYFNRRGVRGEEIKAKAYRYAMYGSAYDVAKQVEIWKSAGVKTIVFNIAFESAEDFKKQLSSLRRMTRYFGYRYFDNCRRNS